MLKVVVLVLTVLFALQHNVRGNPLSSDPPSVNIETRRDTKMFQPESKHWPNFHHSWVPSFPTFSVSNMFADEDDRALAVLKKKVVALENSQKELFEAIEKLDKAIKAPPCDTVLAPVVTDEEPPVITEESDEPLIIEEGNTFEDTKKNQVQSVTEATNGVNGVAVASATNTDKETPPPTKVDEKKSVEGTVAPIENNDALTDVVANGNVANETVLRDDGEKAGSTLKLEELEAAVELTKPQADVALEENEKLGSSAIDVAKSKP